MGFWGELGKMALDGMQALGEAMDPNNHYRKGVQDGRSGAPRQQYSIYPPSNPSGQNMYHATIQCRDAYNRGYDDASRERLLNQATQQLSGGPSYQCSYCGNGTVNSLPAFCPSCGELLSRLT